MIRTIVMKGKKFSSLPARGSSPTRIPELEYQEALNKARAGMLESSRTRRTVENDDSLIDNYDSFTYNLYHYLGELGRRREVFRNNKITLDRDRGAPAGRS